MIVFTISGVRHRSGDWKIAAIQHSKPTPLRPCLADLARRNRMKAAALAKERACLAVAFLPRQSITAAGAEADALNLRPATQKSPQFFKAMQGCARLCKAIQGVSGKKRFFMFPAAPKSRRTLILSIRSKKSVKSLVTNRKQTATNQKTTRWTGNLTKKIYGRTSPRQ